MRTDDFDFHLPEKLIATHPLKDRSAARMLVVDRKKGTIEHKHFTDFPSYMQPEDLLVLNDTKVIPARVFSNDQTIELVVIERRSPTLWECMVRPGKKMKINRTVQVGGSTGTVIEILENGNRIIDWHTPLDLHEHGSLALPHYMGRESELNDLQRYQTVFAQEEGAIAAPTAGLHFTPEILNQLNHTFLTLHVGVGTFRPVKAKFIKDHDMHSERYSLSDETAQRISTAPRVTAVGTTVTRVLETLRKENLKEASGATNIFIYPGFQFQVVDRLLTNFHLPKSTLLMLVSAFAGKELILKAYNEAIAQKYRFYSYGDCMLIQ